MSPAQRLSAQGTRTWLHRSVLSVGEAMIEFAAVGGGMYRRGFAGDTLNTCWHMAQILGSQAQVGYFTQVGADTFSDELVAFIQSSGIDASRIVKDRERSLGMYVISLAGAERHFSYWRDTSAARGLADDAAMLSQALRGCGLIHVSGITLAIVGEPGRRRLIDALAQAREAGATVSFDPNVRMRLWRDTEQMREAMHSMMAVTDIALPSFDDEAQLWGDADPQATLSRYEQGGVSEVVVKDGSNAVAYSVAGQCASVPTPHVAHIRDTTGAGDSFNAGYLAARLVGMDAQQACSLGQRLAGEVIGHFGAMAPREALVPLRELLDELAGKQVPDGTPRRTNGLHDSKFMQAVD